MLFPDFIFETSWEVCNKVGGIYTVLSTRSKTLQERLKDSLIFIGPDFSERDNSLYFKEDNTLYGSWQKKAKEEGLKVKVGRWDIPGRPVAFLVAYNHLNSIKNDFFTQLWNTYQVDSLHAYGDYDESALFSLAVSQVVESFYRFYLSKENKVVFHANEWQTGFAALLLQQSLPEVATIFTTHATCIGRSIAGNNKPLYDYLWAYNGDQMARELNMESKHSIEKCTAHNVDCFTTVSDITAKECAELLDKPVDVVLPNGFEDGFVPKGSAFVKHRSLARKRLLEVANALLGTRLGNDTLIISTSGRYEFRNKGIDVFIDALNSLSKDSYFDREVVAFIEVPAWVNSPRQDLIERLQSGNKYTNPLDAPYITHWLNNGEEDSILNKFRSLNISNGGDSKVKIIFIPCYLTGNDGVFNMDYYDLIIGNDLCVYPSYYEPWGYTPLESVAFKVPCITTNLAGFGLWANKENSGKSTIEDGVEVVYRTDYNYNEVIEEIKSAIVKYAAMDSKEANKCRNAAYKLSKKALWSKFIKHYDVAYDYALRKGHDRLAALEIIE
nr:glycogen/starch synthase [uncultured Prevotella sp.]